MQNEDETTVDSRHRLIRAFGARIKPLGFELPEAFGRDSEVAMLRSPNSPLLVRLEFHSNLDRIYFLPWVRTTSWDFDGERTDVHDVTAIAFAAMVWLHLGVSSSLTYAPGWIGKQEMDAVFINLGQPHDNGFPTTAPGLDMIFELLLIGCLSWTTLSDCRHDGHRDVAATSTDSGYSWEDITPWAEFIAKALRAVNDFNSATYSKRLCPSWSYFHDWRKRVAVIRSESFLGYCREHLPNKVLQTIEGENGRLVVSESCRTFVPYAATKRATKVLRALGDNCTTESFQSICLENRILFLGTQHIVAVHCNSGRVAFEMERDRVRSRFEAEAEFLFPSTEFTWSDEIADDQFESMICELLAKEPGVARVRRAGVTREPDAGRDLIVDWVIPFLSKNVDAYVDPAPQHPISVVAQCKSSKNTVGKGKVKDIRDTVELHSASGYFLAVSSEVSGALIDHLEHLKRTLRFVEWWTRLEIESRLRRHPDIVARYTIVQPMRASSTANRPQYEKNTTINAERRGR